MPLPQNKKKERYVYTYLLVVRLFSVTEHGLLGYHSQYMCQRKRKKDTNDVSFSRMMPPHFRNSWMRFPNIVCLVPGWVLMIENCRTIFYARLDIE
jgi:hypothetical protein